MLRSNSFFFNTVVTFLEYLQFNFQNHDCPFPLLLCPLCFVHPFPVYSPFQFHFILTPPCVHLHFPSPSLSVSHLPHARCLILSRPNLNISPLNYQHSILFSSDLAFSVHGSTDDSIFLLFFLCHLFHASLIPQSNSLAALFHTRSNNT